MANNIKIKNFLIGGNLVKLLSSDLSDRKQFVWLNDTDSELSDVRSCVTQGSIVRPLLFLKYINDLLNLLASIECYEFADDFRVALENQASLDHASNQIEECC